MCIFAYIFNLLSYDLPLDPFPLNPKVGETRKIVAILRAVFWIAKYFSHKNALNKSIFAAAVNLVVR